MAAVTASRTGGELFVKFLQAARCAILICDNQELLSSSPKAGA